MTTIKIVEALKDTIVKTGERFLNVKTLLTDGKIKLEKNYGYPVDTAVKEIEKDLKKVVTLYDIEKAQAEANAKADKAEAKADKTIEALEGKTL